MKPSGKCQTKYCRNEATKDGRCDEHLDEAAPKAEKKNGAAHHGRPSDKSAMNAALEAIESKIAALEECKLSLIRAQELL